MHLLKTIKHKRYFLLFLFIAAFIITRFPDLAGDPINPDGVNWHYRSQQFVVGLKTLNLEKTYQHYHPGVTLMWITGIPVEVLKQISPADQFYTSNNFLVFDFWARFCISFAQLIITLVIIYGLNRILKNFNWSLLVVSLFTFEPFFIGNARLMHMDVLFALLLFAGLVFGYLYINEDNVYDGLVAGGFIGLSVLTKSVGFGAILFLLGTYVFFKYSLGFKKLFVGLGVLGLPFLLTVFGLFPALWVNPIGTVSNIIAEAQRVGIRNGHDQFFFGRYSDDPGVLFYPVVLFIKTSPVFLVGLLSVLFCWSRKRVFNIKSFALFLSVFYIGYFVVMTISSKKLDRYMLPEFMFLSVLGSYGYIYLLTKIKPLVFKGLLAVVLLAFLFVPFFTIKNYLFTYSTPFLTTRTANTVIGQKPFGVGIVQLKDFIVEKYGPGTRVGFIDVKPIESIYPNSLVSDIRVAKTRDYDIFVLAINEEIPDKMEKSIQNFELDHVTKINGLDYWRIYKSKSYQN